MKMYVTIMLGICADNKFYIQMKQSTMATRRTPYSIHELSNTYKIHVHVGIKYAITDTEHFI